LPLRPVPPHPAATGVAPAGGGPAHVPAHHPEPRPDRGHVPGAPAACPRGDTSADQGS
ncbi:unnamed protein product, partial [Tetraodon nigroviridis]